MPTFCPSHRTSKIYTALNVAADPGATAAVEAASGALSRAFATAEVMPDQARSRGVTTEVLAQIGRDLIRAGQSVHVIEVSDRGGVRLQPVSTFDVNGGDDPASWRYRVDTPGPSTTRTRTLPAAAVIHCRYSVDPGRPWRGVGPLQRARLTGRLNAELENALGDEASGTWIPASGSEG